ncbi:hypothetical protein [Pseudaminobacter sp. NGMCC 1.201702]|uniref:hypothetical protein n=1 Tax=Pseudaminobacter sp. NGMCC 1.201702 TaxID=3391825 RepID=UPI0039F0BCA7
MNIMDIERFPPPQRSPSDLNYDADLKAVLGPVLSELLDRAEAAGWDRRKAACSVMFLAARKVTHGTADRS